jgi:phytoene dehydrogenase-like protein
VLAGVAPAVLTRLLGRGGTQGPQPRGTQLKINMLLDHLPRLKSGADPRVAFAGTFHIDEGAAQLHQAYQSSHGGTLPDPLPSEVYCHTLTDRSILPSGSKRQTLTLFGLAAPRAAFNADNNSPLRQRVTKRYLAGLNRYLETPIERSLATDEDGQPCIEAKTPLDIETELGMPRGNIFHGALTWPFATRRADVGSWGVATAVPRIYLCGSGAKRGGCVSGIPGHNAAMQVLQDLGHAEA